MRRTTGFLVVALALVAALSTSGCSMVFTRVERPTQRDTRAIDKGAAETVDAQIRMGVGELKVSGGSGKLMDAEFDYRPASWRPEVRYSVDGTTGALAVEQPSDMKVDFVGGSRNTWDVRLDRDMPLNLTVERGVGTSRLQLQDLTLKSLTVIGGAGDTTIDLSRVPRQDVRVDLQNGVGAVTLRVPREAGVRIFGIHDGVGEWKAEGFTSRGDNAAYNEAYDTAKVRLDIRVVRGVGAVKVEQI